MTFCPYFLVGEFFTRAAVPVVQGFWKLVMKMCLGFEISESQNSSILFFKSTWLLTKKCELDLFVCLFVCLFVSFFLSFFLSLFVCLFVCLFACLFFQGKQTTTNNK